MQGPEYFSMPRYEGYLFLQEPESPRQALSDSHESSLSWPPKVGESSTSSLSPGWVERWCSLEAGQLLVYPDR